MASFCSQAVFLVNIDLSESIFTGFAANYSTEYRHLWNVLNRLEILKKLTIYHV